MIKDEFINQLEEIIKNSMRDLKTNVIIQGSFITGLETSNSDIDL